MLLVAYGLIGLTVYRYVKKLETAMIWTDVFWAKSSGSPRSESEQIVKKVRANNIPVWFLMARDEGHGFAKKKNQDFQFYVTVLFIEEYLLK